MMRSESGPFAEFHIAGTYAVRRTSPAPSASIVSSSLPCSCRALSILLVLCVDIGSIDATGWSEERPTEFATHDPNSHPMTVAWRRPGLRRLSFVRSKHPAELSNGGPLTRRRDATRPTTRGQGARGPSAARRLHALSEPALEPSSLPAAEPSAAPMEAPPAEPPPCPPMRQARRRRGRPHKVVLVN